MAPCCLHTGQEEGCAHWRRGGLLYRGAQPENHYLGEGEEQRGGIPQLYAVRASRCSPNGQTATDSCIDPLGLSEQGILAWH
jgi:hypothetical protein